MVPPGPIKYFFSTPSKRQLFVCTDNLMMRMTIKEFKKRHTKVFNYGPMKRLRFMKKYHCYIAQVNKHICDHRDYQPHIETKPRTPDEVWSKEKKVGGLDRWTIQGSLFNGWKYVTDKHAIKCFEFDWERSRC